MRNIEKPVGLLCGFRFGALGLGALAMLHLAGSSAAQQTTETLFNVFPDAGSVDPAPKELARLAGAIRQAKVPRECPLGELTIYTPKGDKIFQEALSAARRDSLLAALEGLGLGVAGRLFVREVRGSAGKFDVGYSAAHDDKPPTLTTTSQPKKGSKVQPKQQIVVTMVARDDADRFQTGVEFDPADRRERGRPRRCAHTHALRPLLRSAREARGRDLPGTGQSAADRAVARLCLGSRQQSGLRCRGIPDAGNLGRELSIGTRRTERSLLCRYIRSEVHDPDRRRWRGFGKRHDASQQLDL